MMQKHASPALMTPDQVAAYLQVPKATLYQWRHRGLGPRSMRIGRHVRYDPADLGVWLAEQVRESA